MFFIARKQQKAILNLSLDSLNVREQYKQCSMKKYWIYSMKQVILNLHAEKGTLSIISQVEIMVQEMKVL